MVLRGRERDGGFAVAQGEERGFFALQKFLDDDFDSGLAEAAAEHHVDRGFGFGDGPAATTTPLPAARPSALTTIGAPLRARKLWPDRRARKRS